MICAVLLYLDRNLPSEIQAVNTYSLGLSAFEDEILQNGGVSDILQKLLLKMILDERNGEMVNWFVLLKASNSDL